MNLYNTVRRQVLRNEAWLQLRARRPRALTSILIAVALAAATAIVFLPVRHYEFVNFDDPKFVTENPKLRDGLNRKSVRWALTADLINDDPNADYWRPVSYLSHALDVQLFGMHPAGHHLMNLWIHIVAAVALFLVLQSMTDAPWRSGFVAALFALHPLHVESVAWVAERKDLLSGLFFILTLGAYTRYARCPSSLFRYLMTLLPFGLALMSKPMAVTLPFVMLLMDYWPLGRTRWAEPASGKRVSVSPGQLLKEKIPLFALAAAVCAVTFWAQRSVGAVVSLASLSPGTRAANAVLEYAGYIRKTFWPAGLAVVYPLNVSPPGAAALRAGIVLLAVTVASIWMGRRKPWLATGWFWYLGTLVPVIGLVQVSALSMADRYTYVPSIGLFLMLCWSVPDYVMARMKLKVVALIVAGAVLTVCAVLSVKQIGYWKNSETLFRHALNVTRGNPLAHNNLGTALWTSGRPEEALAEFEQAVRLNPDYAEAWHNWAMTLLRIGRTEEAIQKFEQALRLSPGLAESHFNLGLALNQAGRPNQEEIAQYQQALRLKPDYAEAHYDLGVALWEAGSRQEAISHWERALRLKPDYADAHYNFGVALWAEGKSQEAIGHWERALQINPGAADVHSSLAHAFMQLGRIQEAIGHYDQVVRLRPNSAQAHYELGIALEQAGSLKEAVGQYEQALRLKPDFAAAQDRLNLLRSAQ